MNRRRILISSGISIMATIAGCLSNDSMTSTPETDTRKLDMDEVEKEYPAHGHWEHFDIDPPSEETAEAAAEIGDGDGWHMVWILVDSRDPVPVEIDIIVDSETVHKDSAELGIGRYAFYEYTVEAPYLMRVTIEGNDVDLEIEEEHIEASHNATMRGSNQVFCLATDGEIEEVGGIDD